MPLLGRILLPALIAAVLAGGFLTAIQYIEVIPLILEAETFEAAGGGANTGRVHDHGAHDHGDGAVEGGGEAWAPNDGFERTVFTLLSNFLAACGFALLLSVAFVTLRARGRDVNAAKGALWGLAGFGIFSLAPSLGLPPELPGTAAADLGGRQAWWIMTVLLTALGLGVIAFAPRLQWRALGIVPIVLPHIFGAPQPDQHWGLAPAEMLERYVYASLVTNLLFWVALGVLSAQLSRWFAGMRRKELSPA